MNVLLTNPNYKHTWALALHFYKKGHKVYCLSKTRLSLLSFSRFLEKVIFIEDISQAQFDLLCGNYSIDIVVPVGFLETLSFSKFANDSNCKNIVTVSNYENILFASNKIKISEYVENIGVSVPKTYKANSQIFKQKMLLMLKYFFIKPSREGLIKKYFSINSIDEYINSRIFFSKIGYTDNDFILQEFVEGDGVDYFAVCNDGVPLVEYSHIRVREWPKKGGYSTACKMYKNQELSTLSRRIIKSLNWCGPIMIEYRKSKKDGRFYFLEINPKFWGSLELGLLSGVNIVDALIQIVNPNHSNNVQLKKPKYISIAWPLDGDAFHYLSNPSLLTSLFNQDLFISTGLMRDPLYGLVKLIYFPIRLFKEYRL